MPKIRNQRQNARVRALMANTGEGFLVVDTEADVVRLMNESAEEMLGVRRTDVVGRSLSALGAPLLEDEIEKAASRRARRGLKPTMLHRGERTLSCRISPYGTEDEHGLVITIRDDTELLQQQERAQAILASTGDGLVVFSPDNRVTYINPAACDMLGVKAKRVVGKQTTMSELLGLDPPDRAAAIPCWEMRSCHRIECPAFQTEDLRCWLASGTVCDGDGDGDGQPRTFQEKLPSCLSCEVFVRNRSHLEESGVEEVRQLTLDKPTHRIVKARTNPVIDSHGNYIGCVTSLHDITAEHEIAQMKNEFVSTVSHELRTPLTSIKGYVDLILDGEAGEINEIQQEFLGIVKENSDRLVELINALLDISRIESGRIHLKVEPLDIEEAITGAVHTFKALLDQSNCTIETKLPAHLPKAAGDRDRVGQVLVNLISNAIKYSPEGGKVTVAARRAEDSVVVSVKDQGIGIAKEDQRNLFSKFYRVDSSLTREIGGTGLGLSICKTIIELLGGRIWVRSEAGRGSTFSFSLPTAPHELVRTPALEGPGGDGKVLVVDRDPEIATLIETYLRKRGYETLVAHSARDALRLAVAEKPRVITLDVMLDDIDGFELLQMLKDAPETMNIPVLVLSIVCDEGRSCRLGAANYLEKPIDQDRLARVIDDLVGAQSSPCVLVVDDDKDIVKVLSRSLKSKGFSTVCAYDGREAMVALRQVHVDIVLLDLRMPEVDGYQVIQQVKTDEALKDIPIVVMTAHRIDRDRIDILNMASGQVAKPFSPEELAERVEALLSSAEKSAEDAIAAAMSESEAV